MTDQSVRARFARIGGDLVAFDIREDRYLAISGAWDDDGDAVGSGRLRAEAAALLSASGLCLPEDRDGPVRLSPPFRALDCPELRASFGTYVRLALAMARTGYRFARGRHVRAFAEDRLAWCPESDRSKLQIAIGQLRRGRLFLPSPARCLPRALCAALFLRQSDLLVDIVFGVKAHPFDAHCWLEWDGMVVDDDLDRVRRYTPIAVARA